MNKITTTAGIVALGAASLHAAVDAPLAGSQQATKPWSISATLRGFYDDNYATAPDALKRDSFGFEVSPSASVNIIRDQTAFGLNYVYSYRYYQDREHLGLPADDQSHQVNAKLSHAFTPRYKLDLSDSFVYAQEPTLIAGDLPILSSYLRSDSSAYRNHAQGSFSAGITEETTIVLGYSNQWYDYDQEGPNSFSANLDRVENLASINLRQVVLPKTVLVAGYQYERINYTAPSSVSPIVIPPAGATPGFGFASDERDNYSHYFYLGVDQGFTPTLNGSLRAGAQYTDYDNMSTLQMVNPGLSSSQWSPYVDANLTWLYLPGSYAQIGVRHQRAPTDVAFVGTSPNLDAESTSVYGSVNHRFFGGFVASLIAQYQHSTYNDGGSDTADDYFLVGINVTYELNKFVALEAGYNFDHLESDLESLAVLSQPRGFERNRVYIGVRGTY
ncbi:MAG TPA: outer membrane beta-barrel protein [Verrucomicrobiae bacterium]|jgi:hypothetical protein|nr:outer membrane beta-barrel protein [Verrucomicrobiae bacterium]